MSTTALLLVLCDSLGVDGALIKEWNKVHSLIIDLDDPETTSSKFLRLKNLSQLNRSD